MIPIKIKNWEITKDGISWIGKPKINILIPISELATKGTGERKNVFDLIIHTSEKDGILEDDIYALNTALFYAIDTFKIEIPTGMSFVATVIEQQIIIEEKS
jgi:hypothetical protein